MLKNDFEQVVIMKRGCTTTDTETLLERFFPNYNSLSDLT